MSNLSQEAIDALLNAKADETANPDAAAADVDMTASEADAVADVDMPAFEADAAVADADMPAFEADAVADADMTPPAELQGVMMSPLDSDVAIEDRTKQCLTSNEIDLLGEIGNICMGTSSTTMYTLLNQRVSITTPRVRVYTAAEVLSVYQSPFVVVEVEYVSGIEGKNLLILREYDTAVITDLLMGGDGNVDSENIELNEIHMSAMSEIMNQMIGSSATSMANMLGKAVNISTPQATWVAKNTNISPFLDDSELVIKISFDMEIENVLKSEIMQIMSLETGKRLTEQLMPALMPAPAPQQPAPQQPAPQQPAPQPEARPAASAPPARQQPVAEPVDVSRMTYQSFDEAPPPSAASSPIDLIGDIPLYVSVELGRTQKNINEILSYGTGSIVVLDKLAGELVEVVVNGKMIAKGEVVIIDENYGVRITEIITTASLH